MTSRRHGLRVAFRNEGDELRAARHLDRAGNEHGAERGEESPGGCSAHGVLTEQDGVHTVNEFGAAVPCSEGECFSTAGKIAFKTALGKTGEAGGVGPRCVRDADDAFIAGHFALAAETMLDPGQGGAEWEDDKAELLKEVGPVVAAAEVLGFVEDNLLELTGCEARKKPFRDEDARQEEADDTGAVEHVRGTDCDTPAEKMIEAGGKRFADLNRLGGLPQPPQPDGVHGKVGRANEGSEEPERCYCEAPAGIELEQGVR